MHFPTSVIEISKSAFYHNSAQYKNIVASGNLAAVIKSNAYGHGQQLIALLCEQDPAISWLCVSNLSEAVALRLNHIKKPILVLSYLDQDIACAAVHDIAFMCYERDVLDQANAVGKTLKKKLLVHIKVDTGLSRYGLTVPEALSFIQYALTLPYITVQGIFTHFAQVQTEDQTYALEQYHQFQQLLSDLEQENITIPYRHAANSAATTLLEQGKCNFFRVGAGLYGIWPSAYVQQKTQHQYPDFNLRQVISWKTHIAGLRTIPAGCAVGYDRTYITQQPTTLALIPVGYYEGYDRRLSNTGLVRINDYLVPIVGRVCMNVILADVTHVPRVQKGDTVFLLGDYNGIRATDIANQIAGFNPREMVTRLQQSIERLIVE